MHGPLLPIVILCLAGAGVGAGATVRDANRKKLASAEGLLRPVASELVIPVPLATFILILIAGLALIAS
jgi:hypothetical protein